MDLMADIRNLLTRSKKPAGKDAHGGDHLQASGESAPKGGTTSSERAVDEVASGMRSLKERIDYQMQLLRDLTDHLAPQGEGNHLEVRMQEQMRLLQSVSDRLEQSHTRGVAIDEAMEKIYATLEQHAEGLSLLQHQLRISEHSNSQLADTISTLQPTLTEITRGDKRTAELLTQMSQVDIDRQSHMRAWMSSVQTRANAAIISSSVAAVAAIAALVLLLLQRVWS